VKLVRLRRPKIACSLSYADYRPKINAVIYIGYESHTKGKLQMRGVRKGKET
jgi:hypothetical protein